MPVYYTARKSTYQNNQKAPIFPLQRTLRFLIYAVAQRLTPIRKSPRSKRNIFKFRVQYILCNFSYSERKKKKKFHGYLKSCVFIGQKLAEQSDCMSLIPIYPAAPQRALLIKLRCLGNLRGSHRLVNQGRREAGDLSLLPGFIGKFHRNSAAIYLVSAAAPGHR